MVLEVAGSTEVVRLDSPEDVNRLFHRLKFPQAHVGSGIVFTEEPTGPSVLLHRTYVQERARLIWCCRLRPDGEPEGPEVLTPAEAAKRFGI